MKKKTNTSTRKVGKLLASGVILSAGISSLLQAQQVHPGKGKAWLDKGPGGNGLKRIKDVQARRNDALNGNSGNDLMMRSIPGCATTGTAGNDTIALGGTYCDTAFGLAGNDLFYGYSTSTTDTLVVDGGSGADNVQIYSYGPVAMYGGSEDDRALLYTYENVFADGGDGNDNIAGYGYYGNVVLFGDLGQDTLFAGTYESVYVDGSDGSDYISGRCMNGPSIGNGGINDDVISVGTYYGDNVLSGGDGNDYMYGVSVTGTKNHMDGGQGNDVMAVGLIYTYAYSGAASPYSYSGSYLYGGTGADLLLGHVGNDTLVAGAGMDVLRAYGGDDLLVAVDAALVSADGGPGTDLLTADFSMTITSTNLFGMERLDIDGTGINTLTINSSTDIHSATAGINALTSTDSTLVVDGGSGDKVVLNSAWTITGSGTIGSSNYDIYESADSARLWINKDLSVVLLGIDAASLDGNLQVGPIPTEGPVNLQLQVPANGTLRLNVLDLTGKALYTEERFVLAGSYNGTLDLSQFPAGVYLLEVEMGDARATRKLVVQ